MKVPTQFIVVDDDPVNNLVCKFAITSFDPTANIQLFTNPETALNWIREKYINGTEHEKAVLFLDINMPVMNGWEFLDEFSALPEIYQSLINIFILSSSIDPDDKKSAENHPLVRGYFSKPLRKETINQLYLQN
jgi:two-component system chemotaxis response regulator CheY